MSINVGTQEKFYRRGLVLGLTIAEIMILIIFVLLLALASIFSGRDASVEAAERQVERLTDTVAAQQEKLDGFESVFQPR